MCVKLPSISPAHSFSAHTRVSHHQPTTSTLSHPRPSSPPSQPSCICSLPSTNPKPAPRPSPAQPNRPHIGPTNAQHPLVSGSKLRATYTHPLHIPPMCWSCCRLTQHRAHLT